MINKMFSVYDAKAEAYLSPFFMTHEGQAIRTFTDCLQSKEHMFSRHPADYTLFDLGGFDDSNAQFTPKITPKSLGNGVEFLIHPESSDLFPENLDAKDSDVSPILGST